MTKYKWNIATNKWVVSTNVGTHCFAFPFWNGLQDSWPQNSYFNIQAVNVAPWKQKMWFHFFNLNGLCVNRINVDFKWVLGYETFIQIKLFWMENASLYFCMWNPDGNIDGNKNPWEHWVQINSINFSLEFFFWVRASFIRSLLSSQVCYCILQFRMLSIFKLIWMR